MHGVKLEVHESVLQLFGDIERMDNSRIGKKSIREKVSVWRSSKRLN